MAFAVTHTVSLGLHLSVACAKYSDDLFAIPKKDVGYVLSKTVCQFQSTCIFRKYLLISIPSSMNCFCVAFQHKADRTQLPISMLKEYIHSMYSYHRSCFN